MVTRRAGILIAGVLTLQLTSQAQPRRFEVEIMPACQGSPKLAPELRCAVASNATIAGVTVAGRVVLDSADFNAFAALDPRGDNVRPPIGTVTPVRELIVSLDNAAATVTELPGATVTRRSPFQSFVVVTANDAVTPALLRDLAARAQVTSIEPNYPVFLFESQGTSPNDPKFSQQWGLHRINIASVWTKAKTTATSAVVAVIDTGLDVKHADIAPNLWRNTAETLGNGVDDDKNGCVDDQFGCDFTGNGPGVGLQTDPHGHGTHVAGIIGAAGNNKTDTVGVAWTVPIMAIRVFTTNGSATSDRVATAIDYAVKNKASVINCSFGTAQPSPKLKDAIDRAVKADVLIVAAAGNTDGGLPPDNDTTPVFPASSPGVLAVMASDQLDRQQSISRTGRMTIHLAAPGDDIISLKANGGTASRDGTSMAAPFVSGVAALARGMAPSFGVSGIAKDLIMRARKVTTMKGLSMSEAILDASFLAPSSLTTTAIPSAKKAVPPKLPQAKTPVAAGPPSQWIGRVTTGIVALGAESSGLALTTDEGSLELAGPGPMLKELAAMDGQTVRIFGAAETRTTAARGTHTVVRVTKWERR